MGQGFQQRRYKHSSHIVEEQVRIQTNGFKLNKFKFRKEIRKNWFTNKVVEEWTNSAS